MEFIRLSKGLKKYDLIPINDDIWKYIESNDIDYYTSLYYYNKDHYVRYKTTNSVAGIRDVTTNRLVFDFDSKSDISRAQNDAMELISRLVKDGISQEKIQVSFSGSKGFCVELLTDEVFTPLEFKAVTFSLAEGLETFDKVVNDSQRLIRVIGTKNPKSGLYKIPLNIDELNSLTVEQIKTKASTLDGVDTTIMDKWDVITLPSKFKKMKNVEEDKKPEGIVADLDMSLKPKWLSEAKYALQEGFFGSGERNTALMILASTYKNQGINEDIVYRMLKGVAEVQAKRNNVERYSDEEIYNNILKVVFSPTWTGGTYSYENTPLLQEVTKRLGLKIPKDDNNSFVSLLDVSGTFRKFATEIEKNTIKLGIESLDKDVRITTSMLVNLLAAPSAGKTSISFNVLNNASKNNVSSIFYSLDMGAPLVYQRLLQKHTGLGSKELFRMYENNDKRLKEIEERVAEEYKKVAFSFNSGMTPEDIERTIIEQQEKTGEKVKLVVVDYLECISTKHSDPTASSGLAAQTLKDIANRQELTVLLLVQPQKHAGDPSSELLSMRNIKGSSQLEQAASIILTMWRPGFNPKSRDDDRYLSMAVVKNRMGQIGKYDFGWNGLTGSIRELDFEEQDDLKQIIDKQIALKAIKDGNF